MTLKNSDAKTLNAAAIDAAKKLEVKKWHNDISFVRIYKILSSLFGDDIELMKHWVHTSNAHLGGRFPVDLIQSEEGIDGVASYLLPFSR